MQSLFKLLLVASLVLPAVVLAQGAQIAFGGLSYDGSEPVEVTADTLRVDQDGGTAVFSGSVVVIQGTLRLAAEEVGVEYETTDSGGQGDIDQMVATGDVVLTSGDDAAEGQSAIYRVADGTVTMTGDVLLTQGPSTLAGQKLVLDLEAGTGTMEGRVRTILQTGGN